MNQGLFVLGGIIALFLYYDWIDRQKKKEQDMEAHRALLLILLLLWVGCVIVLMRQPVSGPIDYEQFGICDRLGACG